MKVQVAKNTTAFTTRSLSRVVRRAFDRAGIKGNIRVSFIGRVWHPSAGIAYRCDSPGSVAQFPGDRTGQATVCEGNGGYFWIGPNAEAVELCSAARFVGYAIRGVKGRELSRLMPASPADREFLADKPLVRKKGREPKPSITKEELKRRAMEKKFARTQQALLRAMQKARRLERHVKKLRRRERYFARMLEVYARESAE